MSDLVTLEASYELAETSQHKGPLSVLLSPSGHYTVEAGESFDISLTLENQGNLGAVIDAYIDETAQAVCEWCANPYERLALEVGYSSEIRFKVAVPVQTLPGTYDYLIVVDAPNHYPEDTPLRYPATVQILPPVKAAVNLNDATFATRPETSSDKPVVLELNTPLEVEVIVHNRSNRVDQFRLEMTDLPDDWYEVVYPEGLGELGLVIDTDHVSLNPGVKGLIRVMISCPPTTLAGRYLATMQLHSANDPKLVLMDVFYLEVPAIYDLTVHSEAIIRKVKRQAGLVHLALTNAGNTAREITLQTQEDREDPLFTYKIEPAQLRIPSMTTAQATLTAEPIDMGHQAWFGRGRPITFRLVANDRHDLPLPDATTDEMLWEPRPWWHLALVILFGAGLLGTLIFLIWWFFLRPPAPPKVLDFGATAPTYYEQQNGFVRLTWQIENPKQIQTLELRSEADEANAPPPIIYDLSHGLPPELEDYCTLAQTLNCSNVFTSARYPGTYQFTLTVSPKGKAQPITAQTTDIRVLPAPPPEIVAFAPTQTRYWEAPAVLDAAEEGSNQDAETQPTKTVALNWQITFVEPLSHLILTAQLGDGTPLDAPQEYDLSKGLPKALEEFCTLTDQSLICRAVPTNARTVGDFVFELNVFGLDGEEPVATAMTEPVQIVPLPIKIETFTLNGEPVPPKYQVIAAPGATVQLAWRVTGGPYTKVEILPNPGSVPLLGSLAYPLTGDSREVVTLQVTSVTGEQLTRSLTLETTTPTPPEPLSPDTFGPVPPGGMLPPPLSDIVSPPPPVDLDGDGTADLSPDGADNSGEPESLAPSGNAPQFTP